MEPAQSNLSSGKPHSIKAFVLLVFFLLVIFLTVFLVKLFVVDSKLDKASSWEKRVQFQVSPNSLPGSAIKDFYMRMIEADEERGLVAQAEIEGRIVGAIIKNSKGAIVVPMEFRTKEGKIIDADVYLGQKDFSILTYVAANGIISNQQDWKYITVGELMKLLKTDSPLIVRMLLDIPPEKLDVSDFLKNNHSVLRDQAREFSRTNTIFTEIIKESKEYQPEYKIGAISGLIVYQK